MQNKPAPKSWHEIEVLLSAISIALTLGLWNVFASSSKNATAAPTDASPTDQPQPTNMVSITPTPTLSLLPGQVLLLGGVLPTTDPNLQPTPLVPGLNNNGGGGGGKPPPSKPPPPPTHHSHP